MEGWNEGKKERIEGCKEEGNIKEGNRNIKEGRKEGRKQIRISGKEGRKEGRSTATCLEGGRKEGWKEIGI